MAKTTHKRRVVKKNPTLQKERPEGPVARKRNINWAKWVAIAIAVLVSLSMILSLIKF
ncbi:MAG: hypothetical protein KDE56_24810 [Anaerolineales bacterium]|nr:hypothetical protein [Anaerolineales bacterium]